MLGSIVQKGKLADCAFALDKQLNKVDLPTLGNPTIPHFKAIFSFKICGAKVIYSSILFSIKCKKFINSSAYIKSYDLLHLKFIS
jgi:hypothetical protein